jgi:hypothetical protein
MDAMSAAAAKSAPWMMASSRFGFMGGMKEMMRDLFEMD